MDFHWATNELRESSATAESYSNLKNLLKPLDYNLNATFVHMALETWNKQATEGDRD